MDSSRPADEEDINRMGEKVVLREQVKELFNRKYGNQNEASADASGSAVAQVQLTANVSRPCPR